MEFKNSKNIALQIADNLAERILNGNLLPNERIPSVRELATELGVNPNTIVRTYAALQDKEVIRNQRGVGYFVSENASKIIKNWRKEEFYEIKLPEFVHQIDILEIDFEDLKEPILKIRNSKVK